MIVQIQRQVGDGGIHHARVFTEKVVGIVQIGQAFQAQAARLAQEVLTGSARLSQGIVLPLEGDALLARDGEHLAEGLGGKVAGQAALEMMGGEPQPVELHIAGMEQVLVRPAGRFDNVDIPDGQLTEEGPGHHLLAGGILPGPRGFQDQGFELGFECLDGEIVGTADQAEETPEPVSVGQEDVADLQLAHLERAFGPDDDLGGIHSHPLPGTAVHAFDADGGDGALHRRFGGRAADADGPVGDLLRDDGDHEFTLGHLLPVQQTLEHSGVHGHRAGGEGLHRAGHGLSRYQRFLGKITSCGAGEQGRVPCGGQDAVPQEGHAGQDEAGAERHGGFFQDRVVRALVGDTDVAEFQGEAQGIDVHRIDTADGGVGIDIAQGIPDGLFHQRLAGKQSPHDGEDTNDECGRQAFRCFRHGSSSLEKRMDGPC